jgi:hypothetical protein
MKPMTSRWTTTTRSAPARYHTSHPAARPYPAHNGSTARSARVRDCALLPRCADWCARITQGRLARSLSYDDPAAGTPPRLQLERPALRQRIFARLAPERYGRRPRLPSGEVRDVEGPANLARHAAAALAGKAPQPRKGACFMELVSYLGGERWSDLPACTHSLLASVARLVNDHTSDEGRPQPPS